MVFGSRQRAAKSGPRVANGVPNMAAVQTLSLTPISRVWLSPSDPQFEPYIKGLAKPFRPSVWLLYQGSREAVQTPHNSRLNRFSVVLITVSTANHDYYDDYYSNRN